jgi:hypothetical protein
VDNVVKNGVSCSYTTCDHPQLQQFIKGIAITNSAINAADVTKWVKKVKNATSGSQPAAQPAKSTPSSKAKKVQGYKMVEEKIVKDQWKTPPAATLWLYFLIVALQLVIVLIGAGKRLYL